MGNTPPSPQPKPTPPPLQPLPPGPVDPSKLNSILPLPLNYFSNSYTSLISILAQGLAFQATTGDWIETLLITGGQYSVKSMMDLLKDQVGGLGSFTSSFRLTPAEATAAINIPLFLFIAKDQPWATQLFSMFGGFSTAEAWSLFWSLIKGLFGSIGGEDLNKFCNQAIQLGGGRTTSVVGIRTG